MLHWATSIVVRAEPWVIGPMPYASQFVGRSRFKQNSDRAQLSFVQCISALIYTLVTIPVVKLLYSSQLLAPSFCCILCSVKFSINSAHLVCPVVCLITAKNSEFIKQGCIIQLIYLLNPKVSKKGNIQLISTLNPKVSKKCVVWFGSELQWRNENKINRALKSPKVISPLASARRVIKCCFQSDKSVK